MGYRDEDALSGCVTGKSALLLVCRADYCDIRINLLKVSREHAEIVVDEKDQVARAQLPPLDNDMLFDSSGTAQESG